MADALSLAVNIFTLLEFGRKFAFLALDIHKNGKDAVSSVTSLDLTSKDLSKVADELGRPGSSPRAHDQDQTDERIHQLAARCIKVSGHIQNSISGLGMDRVDRKTGRAVVKAFRLKWKESDIVGFQSEIEDLRSELMLNMIFWLRTGMTKSLDNQDRMIQEFLQSRSHDEGLKKRLDDQDLRQESLFQRIIEIFASNTTSVVRPNGDNPPFQDSFETDLMNAMSSFPQQTGDDDVAKLQMSPFRLSHVRNQFINMFRYDSMFDRESGVAEAHPDTLKWIFEEPSGESHRWDNFSQWLESEGQLYWITGKMGSGKSTLMKYISEELPAAAPAGWVRRCTPHLRQWAQDRPLCIASFYFWAGSNEDTRIQTSVEGLYRTLLTQLLEVYPEATPHVSPRRWENLCLFGQSSKAPGIKELKAMLSKAIKHVSSMARICLFIDGLDEFEGTNDDLQDLMTWVKILIKTSPVKLCVASRPWGVFEDALQDRPHLLMEEFNFKDIQRYVWRRFSDDANFMARKQVEPALCNQFLDEIVTKSEGVFLWVHLVCTSLLRAMSRGDLVGRLREILKELPDEMERLYDHILGNIEPRDKDHAAKYFLLLQACLGRPDALLFSYADDIDEDSEFSLKMSRKTLTETETQYRATELAKRLNSRCRGILRLSVEAPESKPRRSHLDIGTVQYCHRSAKDYLKMSSIQGKLIEMLGAPFDPHLRLCSAYLARRKCCGKDAPDSERHISTCNCAEYAAMMSSESHGMMIRVLDDLSLDFEAELFTDHVGRQTWFGGNFLSFTVVLGVIEYVKHNVGQGQGCVVRSLSVYPGFSKGERDETGRSARSLDKQQLEIGRMENFLEGIRLEKQPIEWPLLLDALLSRRPPRPETVSLLLENGADPNIVVRVVGRYDRECKKSALDVVLYHLRVWSENKPSDRPEGVLKEAWVDSLCLLLRYGARPDRSDVQFLRKFIGEDVIQARKLPHLGRHRELIANHLAPFGLGRGRWGNFEV